MKFSKFNKLTFALVTLLSLTSCGETPSSSETVKKDKEIILDIVSKYENGEIETFKNGTFTMNLNGTTIQQVKGKNQNTVNKLKADFSNELAYFDVDSKLVEGNTTQLVQAVGEVSDKLYADIHLGGVKDSAVLLYLRGKGAKVSTSKKSADLKGYKDGVTVSKVLEETIGISSIPIEGNLPKVTLSEERKTKLHRELDRPEEELSYKVVTQGDNTNMYFTYKHGALSELATEAYKDDDPSTEDPTITVDKDATMLVTLELNKYYHPVRIITQTDVNNITKTYKTKATPEENEVINLEERDEINFTYGTETRSLANKEECTIDLQPIIDDAKKYMGENGNKLF